MCWQYFFKTNLFKESMKKFVALPRKEERSRINGKTMTLTFFELFKVYIQKLGQYFFSYLLINLVKQRYISSILINLNKFIN